MTADRITELEIKTAFQEDLLESLNATVARQGQEIRMLQEELRFLYARVKTLLESTPGAEPTPEDEVPPHY